LPAHEIAHVLNEARARWTPAGATNLMHFHPCGP